MSSSNTVQSEYLATGHQLNWKRGGIALLLAIPVVGLGHLYDRRWRLAIAYELLLPFLLLVARATILHSIVAGFSILIGAVLLQLVVVGQAAWFSLHRPKNARMPRLSKGAWVLSTACAVLSTVGWGSGFFQRRVAGLRGYTVNSESMAPAIKAGDRIFVDTEAYEDSPPQRNDIVVFAKEPNVVLVKRVVAVGGDTIDVKEDAIVLDNKPLKEPYLAPPDSNASSQRVFPQHVVASGNLFVLGDNRKSSYDSRYFGDVSDKAVIGKALGIYWSRDRSRVGRPIR